MDQPDHPPYWTQEPLRKSSEIIVAMQSFAKSSETSLEALMTIQCFMRCVAEHGSTLRYAKEVRLVLNGMAISSSKIMMDDGANIDLMDDTFRQRHGIRMFQTTTRLSTSLSTETEALGLTEIVGNQYGSGENAIRVARPFLVAKGMGNMYDVLIGNQDTRAYNATICAKENTYTMRRPGHPDLIVATISR